MGKKRSAPNPVPTDVVSATEKKQRQEEEAPANPVATDPVALAPFAAKEEAAVAPEQKEAVESEDVFMVRFRTPEADNGLEPPNAKCVLVRGKQSEVKEWFTQMAQVAGPGAKASRIKYYWKQPLVPDEILPVRFIPIEELRESEPESESAFPDGGPVPGVAVCRLR